MTPPDSAAAGQLQSSGSMPLQRSRRTWAARKSRIDPHCESVHRDTAALRCVLVSSASYACELRDTAAQLCVLASAARAEHSSGVTVSRLLQHACATRRSTAVFRCLPPTRPDPNNAPGRCTTSVIVVALWIPFLCNSSSLHVKNPLQD